jgi:hypothetical protein
MLIPPKAPAFPDVIGTFMARDALALVASYLRLTRDDVVLLPAYLCREVLKPFGNRSRVLFYDVDTDLTVCPAAIRRILRFDGRLRSFVPSEEQSCWRTAPTRY